jgi:O-acetyl-ADP-ribose deacetylase (regulator of RNase III)
MLDVKASHRLPSGQILEVCQGDITAVQVDAIVNAANSQLAHGGGVAAAIVRKGGDVIQLESSEWIRRHGPVPHDQPAYTGAGSLPSKYVIHAVGPVWGEGQEKIKLHSAVTGSLEKAAELKLTSIAFPAISTGIFGFPKDLAASIFMKAIPDFFSVNPSSSLREVKIVLYDHATLDAFLSAFHDSFDQTD